MKNNQDIGEKNEYVQQRVNIPQSGLLPDEENDKCGIVRCCVEFPSIGNHRPKRKPIRGGLSDWYYSQSHWKLEPNRKS